MVLTSGPQRYGFCTNPTFNMIRTWELDSQSAFMIVACALIPLPSYIPTISTHWAALHLVLQPCHSAIHNPSFSLWDLIPPVAADMWLEWHFTRQLLAINNCGRWFQGSGEQGSEKNRNEGNWIRGKYSGTWLGFGWSPGLTTAWILPKLLLSCAIMWCFT